MADVFPDDESAADVNVERPNDAALRNFDAVVQFLRKKAIISAFFDFG